MAFVALLAVMTPLWLGSATVPVLTALGFGPEHQCACGMVRGQCGCPECERLEQQRQRESAPRPYSVLKSTCDSQDSPLPSASVPPGVMPVALLLRESPVGTMLPQVAPVPLLSFVGDGPPTPPPRLSTLQRS
jgi:hypothetical protein